MKHCATVRRENTYIINPMNGKSYNRKLGAIGEAIAAKYLEGKRYVVLETNYSKVFGEIDLIAKAPDSTLVFCEVKTMLGNGNGFTPEDQLTVAKLKKTRRISKFFANQHPQFIDDEIGWRIDLIAVMLSRKISGGWKAAIRHYEGVV